MTTTRLVRCNHCNEVYAYHPSSYGMSFEFNNKDYCSECTKVIEKALSKVKVKFELRWIETNDYSKEEIVETQNKRCKSSSLPFRRYMAPLYKNTAVGIQPMDSPVGLAYKLRFQYSTNEEITEDWSKEKIKEENKEYDLNNLKLETIDKTKKIEIELSKSPYIQNSVCELMKDPKSGKMIYYHVTWWDDKPDEVEITKEVWWDIKNNCIADNQMD